MVFARPVVNGDHRKEATIDVTFVFGSDIFCNNFDTNFHRRMAGMVDCRQESNKFPNVNRLTKGDLIHAQSYYV